MCVTSFPLPVSTLLHLPHIIKYMFYCSTSLPKLGFTMTQNKIKEKCTDKNMKKF